VKEAIGEPEMIQSTAATIDPWALPSMPLESFEGFPDCPCVYFALKEEIVLYVGKTVAGLASRWRSHHRLQQLMDEGNVMISWMELRLPDSELQRIERQLIEHLCPTLNATRVKPSVDRGKKQGLPMRVSPTLINRFNQLRAIRGCTNLSETVTDAMISGLELLEESAYESDNQRLDHERLRAKRDGAIEAVEALEHGIDSLVRGDGISIEDMRGIAAKFRAWLRE
jgi:hypothetical protein